jgi:hypothetical protein
MRRLIQFSRRLFALSTRRSVHDGGGKRRLSKATISLIVSGVTTVTTPHFVAARLAA